jgi:hydrogenase maturation protease
LKRKQAKVLDEADLDPMKTIVVGLGNPILGDDGVGWKVAEEVKRHLDPDSHVRIECASLGGISLMEKLIGYDRAILIDAFTADASDGSISVLRLDHLPNYSAYHIASIHDTSLQNAIELGRSMGAQLPHDITVVGIATQTIYDFSEELSPAVASVVPCASCIVLDMLKEIAMAE